MGVVVGDWRGISQWVVSSRTAHHLFFPFPLDFTLFPHLSIIIDNIFFLTSLFCLDYYIVLISTLKFYIPF